MPVRIFLVGAPRSGTTLLQGMLAAHPAVFSLPETHFFSSLAGGPGWRGRLRAVLGMAGPRFRDHLYATLVSIGLPEARDHFRTGPLARRRNARAFIRLLDTAAIAHGHHVWVEKTPNHVRHIRMISRLVPEARFVHIVRAGPDVVASLHAVTRRHPAEWDGPWSIARCIEAWRAGVRATLRHASSERHFVIRYEALCARPEAVLRPLTDWVGIPYSPAMLAGRAEAVASVMRATEPWKAGAQEPLRPAASATDDEFSAPDRERIRDSTRRLMARVDTLFPVR